MSRINVEFRILGPIEALLDERALPLGSPKQRMLVAALLLRPNGVVSVDELIDALWGESAPKRAAKSLQVYVWQLRKVLGHEVLQTHPPGYTLVLPPGALDLDRFEALLARARAEEPSRAAATLREALGLFRGRPLAEFAAERFAEIEVARIEALRLEALEERIEADLALGRHAALVGELEALVAAEPLRERPRAQLMVALYRCGRQAEALEVYRKGRHSFVEELGIEPSRRLQELEQAILRHDPALELPSIAAAVAPPHEPEPEGQVAARRVLPEERKTVSVLFVELGGVGALFGPGDPEDLRAALRPFQAAAKWEIEQRGGTVEKLIGDAVMAVFGAPVAHEDDPERAVRAALALRQWVVEQSEDLRVRMAVNTGVALVALDTRPPEGEAIATGDVVSMAQRLQAAAPLDAILVGEQTYRATRESIEYRAVPPVEAKGNAAPVSAWEALDARAGLGVDLMRAPKTPLVGRQRELDLLVSALARVKEERSSQLVTLVGVPGIGKSRLVFELSRIVDHERASLTWCQGRCLPYGDGVSYWALGEAVKALVGILESDSPGHVEEKLRRAVNGVAGESSEALWVEEQLQVLVGATGDRGSVARADASAAWRHFVTGWADRRPLVLVLEDLHWADEGLLDFADELADRSRDVPLLILCTARPELLERRQNWGGGKANALTITLPPLSDDETSRIFAARLEQPLLEADAQKTLVARADGNPLYAEQFARMLSEVGSHEELPETVHGIIAARLDGLAPSEKALLQDAAVVGKVFWPGAIEAVGDRPGGDVEELLVGLERKEFVQQARRSTVAGESEYAFRHVLLRDVAYGQLPRAARSERHSRAAAWIESLGRPEDHAEMLAYHYLNALEYARAAGRVESGLADRARLALRSAGDRALALASYQAAAGFYSAALAVWPESDPDRAWLVVSAGRSSFAADGTGVDLLEEGFEALRSRGDAEGAAEVAVDLARCSWQRGGDRDATYAYIDQALELAPSREDSEARAYALVERAAYHMSASEHPQAIGLAREALALAEASELRDLRVRALDVLGTARAVSGDAGGLDDSKQAIALARERSAFSRLIIAERNLYFSELFLGHLAAASEALSTHRQDVERYGSADQRRSSLGAEAHEAVLYGRWDEAAAALDELIAGAEAGADHYEDAAWRVSRASIALGRGDLGSASTLCERAVERARTLKDAQVLAPALTFRGIVLLAEGRHDEALRLAPELLQLGASLVSALTSVHPTVTLPALAWLVRDLEREDELLSALASAPATPWCSAAQAIVRGDLAEAVALAARIGAPLVEAHTRLRSAQELARAGHRAEARDCLAPALPFFNGVGATHYLDGAEQVLASSS